MPDNNPKIMNRQNDGWVYGDVLPIAHNPTSNEFSLAVPNFLYQPFESLHNVMSAISGGNFYGNEAQYMPQIMDIAGMVNFSPLVSGAQGSLNMGMRSLRPTSASPGTGEPISSYISPIGYKLKHYIDALNKLGVENAELIAPEVKKEAAFIRELRGERREAKRGLSENLENTTFAEANRAYGASGLKARQEGISRKADAEKIQQQKKYELDDYINSVFSAPGNENIAGSFMARMTAKAKYAHVDRGEDFIHEAVLGSIDALKRQMQKEGWTIRHTSKWGDRNSSTYLVSPNKDYEVRVSDHYLPSTEKRILEGNRWNDEIVIGKNDLKQGLSSIRDRILKHYQENSE